MQDGLVHAVFLSRRGLLSSVRAGRFQALAEDGPMPYLPGPDA